MSWEANGQPFAALPEEALPKMSPVNALSKRNAIGEI